MRNRQHHFLQDERGGELIEFAIAALLFFSLLFGIMEFGRAIWIYGTTAHAAREGARYAIVRGAESGRAASASDVATYVQGVLAGMQCSPANTTWSPDNKPGSVVTVQVNCPFSPAYAVLPAITLTSTSKMVISY